MIAIWGSRESGKTTFILALYYDIVQRSKQNKLWSMIGADTHSDDFIVNGFRQIAEEHRFPDRTEVLDLTPLRFNFQRPLDGGRPPETKLGGVLGKMSTWFQGALGGTTQDDSIEFLDPSGEFFAEPAMMNTDQGEVYRHSITACDGLVCLIDPVRKDGTSYYFPLLYRNFAMLSRLMNGEGNPGRLPVPVAVCVTKADQFESAFDDPRAFLEQHMGEIDFSVFDNFCQDIRFFATSAIGLNNVEKLDEKNFKPLGPPKPKNVFEPIEWLLGRGVARR